MKVNYCGKKKFKPARRQFATLSHYGFTLVVILSGIIILLATPVLAQDIPSLGPCKNELGPYVATIDLSTALPNSWRVSPYYTNPGIQSATQTPYHHLYKFPPSAW
ncbi:MAG: hypothetical protein ABSC11_15180, partial [Smithella sp.]